MKTKKIFGIFEVGVVFGHTFCKEHLELECTFSKHGLYCPTPISKNQQNHPTWLVYLKHAIKSTLKE